MPDFKEHLTKQEFWVDATDSLKGKDEHGAWKTARAKEYPFRLSLAIANAMIAAAKRPPVRFALPHLSAILGTMQPYAPQLTDQDTTIGMDFVDNIAPICHLKANWSPDIEMYAQAQAQYTWRSPL